MVAAYIIQSFGLGQGVAKKDGTAPTNRENGVHALGLEPFHYIIG
jgi:hypothetical protein